MMSLRTQRHFTVSNPVRFKQNLVAWSQQFEIMLWLDSNSYPQKYTTFDACLAAEAFTSIKTDANRAFENLKNYCNSTQDYLFGYLSYDVKNDVEKLESRNFDGLHFPDMYFFQPQKLIFIKKQTVEFCYLPMVEDDIERDFLAIQQYKHHSNIQHTHSKALKITPRISKEAYHQKLDELLVYIHRGDVYEANFCQEFYAENSSINPYQVYTRLNAISEPPFATLMRLKHLYLLSASPERFIRKDGQKIISQPIKGTVTRYADKTDDLQAANDLVRNEKERSENTMVVDLVRNDLSKTALKGSVEVEELCHIYSFKQVHQMVSTIVSEISNTTHPVDIIRVAFPMASMTGVPKISAMGIIEKLEETKRGLYSGAVGYFTPNHDFDFNVVIRSILYNEEKQYVSYSVGGAITAKSLPEQEYEECLLKAKAMKRALTDNSL